MLLMASRESNDTLVNSEKSRRASVTRISTIRHICEWNLRFASNQCMNVVMVLYRFVRTLWLLPWPSADSSNHGLNTLRSIIMISGNPAATVRPDPPRMDDVDEHRLVVGWSGAAMVDDDRCCVGKSDV